MYIYLSCIVVRAEDSELKDLLIKGKPVQSCFSIMIISVHQFFRFKLAFNLCASCASYICYYYCHLCFEFYFCTAHVILCINEHMLYKSETC